MTGKTDVATPPRPPRAGQRVPSGPRPPPVRLSSTSSLSAISPDRTTQSDLSPLESPSRAIRHAASRTSLAALGFRSESPLDALIDGHHGFTASPEQSPKLSPSKGITNGRQSPVSSHQLDGDHRGGTLSPKASRGLLGEAAEIRTNSAPSSRPRTPQSIAFSLASPTGSTSITSPKTKPPKPSRLQTNLGAPTASPTKQLSPSLQHWHQVRSHVITTPHEEKGGAIPSKGKKFNIVSKAAGKFGFRHAAEHVIGYDDRRRSLAVMLGGMGDLTPEQREEIARERRKFARDIKSCLDGCTAEETRRRISQAAQEYPDSAKINGKTAASSIHTSSHMVNKVPDKTFISSFAPLLLELHKHLPAARAKKAWSRTLPHHGSILAELSVVFLPESATTTGERQQALEVFGVIIKHWAADNADEELDRWLFLARALQLDDRQLRSRGLNLLGQFLHQDPSIPSAPERPHTAIAFLLLCKALIQLLHCVSTSKYDVTEHFHVVSDFVTDLANGNIIEVEKESLPQLLGEIEVPWTLTGVERELAWIACGQCIALNHDLAEWILQGNAQIIKNLQPPPILHDIPPVIERLRQTACIAHLTALSGALSEANTDLSRTIWSAGKDLIETARHHDDMKEVKLSIGRFLMTMEIYHVHNTSTQPPQASDDPFLTKSISSKNDYRSMLTSFLADEAYKASIHDADREAIIHLDGAIAVQLLRIWLGDKSMFNLAKECLQSFYERLSDSALAISPDVHSFLRFLSVKNPQLLYKPLFSLSASTQPSSLQTQLRTITNLSKAIGPTRFWTYADPQMVVIVLMGDITPKTLKGKEKQGDIATINIKLGRYAVLIEFIKALEDVDEPAHSGTRLRAFVEIVENRLGVMLEAEEKGAVFPDWYRALICTLFFRLRRITRSLKRTAWQRLVLAWYLDLARNEPKTPHLSASQNIVRDTIHQAYRSISSKASDPRTKSDPRSPSAKSTLLSPPPSSTLDALTTLTPRVDVPLGQAISNLLVLIQACLDSDDWTKVAEIAWYSLEMQNTPADTSTLFILMKCAEHAAPTLRQLITADLRSSHAQLRYAAYRKVAALYGYRFQILSQTILSDRRGPIFQWPTNPPEFVMMEIGSPVWSAPHAAQDAALQKFGRSLPLELRHRLMDLGWSDDANIDHAAGDAEQMPISLLPSLQSQEASSVEMGQSPSKNLMRRGSSASESSLKGKKRRAVIPPLLSQLLYEDAQVSFRNADSVSNTLLQELLRTFQRDDAAIFLRPFIQSVSTNFSSSLNRLNGVITGSIPPTFAYSAFNALAGYLKHVLRIEHAFHGYASALCTMTLLASSVSEISLRDIRKNKAESILLPASIHEEHGGFNLHAPWRDGSVEVRTAQILFLTECLKANPREVYLIKKMLSNLPIQPSTSHLPFSRAWLILIATLFGIVNRNYNDRAELRHFLFNVASILRLHGTSDILITSYAMRVFMLCSARFRRIFISMGINTIMDSTHHVYANGNPAVKDCVEYAFRSFYRIHSDVFVYQSCMALADGQAEAASVYKLLSSLSVPSFHTAGIASGIRGVNDKEEIDAIVQMLSGPEIALSEIGTDRAERQAVKLASLELEDKLFPKENIIKLFVTVIAASPTSKRSGNFLRLLAGITPHIHDQISKDLLKEGIEALGNLISKGRVRDETAIAAFHPDEDSQPGDWFGARRDYVLLVEAFAVSGGHLTASATRITLDIVLDLLRKQPEAVGPAASTIVQELTKTHLASTRALQFLRDIATLFSTFIAVVDFSGMLEHIADHIEKSSFELSSAMTEVIIERYVDPSVRLLASTSEDSTAFLVPLRSAIVRLLSTAVYLRGDAFGVVEHHPPNASLLATLILPIALTLRAPTTVDRQAVHRALWVRILNYMLRPNRRLQTTKVSTSRQSSAATGVLTLQIVKIVILRAPEAIQATKGLWAYLTSYIANATADANGKFTEKDAVHHEPRIVDWMLWTFFEMLSLHATPLMIHFRSRIQIQLQSLQQAAARSRPSTPGDRPPANVISPRLLSVSGRARMASIRSPSIAFQTRSPSNSSPDLPPHARVPSSDHLSPESAMQPRVPTAHLTPYLGHSRNVSGGSISSGGARPSFADLSARRASRPIFDGLGNASPQPGMRFRFPSSAPVRALAANEKGMGGGAIIHLLGAPAQVLSATSSQFPTLAPRASMAEKALRDIRIKSDVLSKGARRAIKVCMVVFGWEWEGDEEDEEPVRSWSVHDALQVITDQTRHIIEDEFQDVFNPSSNRWKESSHNEQLEKALEAGQRLARSTTPTSPNEKQEWNEKPFSMDGGNQKEPISEGYSMEIPSFTVTTP